MSQSYLWQAWTLGFIGVDCLATGPQSLCAAQDCRAKPTAVEPHWTSQSMHICLGVRRHGVFLFSPVQLQCQVGVLYHPSSSSSPVLDVSVRQTTLVHAMADVVHSPHSWSSFCPLTSHFHLHRLLHLISFVCRMCSCQCKLACLALKVMFSFSKSPNSVPPSVPWSVPWYTKTL